MISASVSWTILTRVTSVRSYMVSTVDSHRWLHQDIALSSIASQHRRSTAYRALEGASQSDSEPRKFYWVGAGDSACIET